MSAVSSPEVFLDEQKPRLQGDAIRGDAVTDEYDEPVGLILIFDGCVIDEDEVEPTYEFGVHSPLISPADAKRLRDWLDAYLKATPESLVMEAALKEERD